MTTESLLADTVWPERLELEEWHAFLSHVDKLTRPGSGPLLLFRGQSRRWALQPTLLRSLPSLASHGQVITAEREALAHFKSQAHLHERSGFPAHAESPGLADWWALMQHHGAPTRLLDWTASPYVAAYFAAEKDPDADGAILVINATAILGAYGEANLSIVLKEDYMFKATPDNELYAFTPFYKTNRLVAQQGYFTVATAALESHEVLLHSKGAARSQLVIKSAFKQSLLHRLRTMNVGAQSLFPGLDGLGRTTGDLVRTSILRNNAT